MTKKMQGYMITGGIALAVSAAVVWASNNVDFVEDLIG